ncbi:hypothetical protein [Enterococcus lemanii]|uniref:Uncharacterized protein n=1 Tax=Enterococcus lemanii TaxID=1159752 RepID=A0ABV9MRN7_9ENTE|nr:hypothetical protein [Enterococcus lemanii]MBM7709063.1 hypothetical protein [Enterococcus lemanii]
MRVVDREMVGMNRKNSKPLVKKYLLNNEFFYTYPYFGLLAGLG